MKKDQYQYYAVKVQQMAARIEFESLTDMCRFNNVHQITDVFILHEENPVNDFFGIYFNNCLMLHNTDGYKTLEGFETAVEKGFPDALSFYEALSLGYTKYDDYLLVKESGISDVLTFETMKKKGFIAGFPVYQTLMKEYPIEINMVINNPYDLYTYAKKNNFEDFSQIIEAFTKGFIDADLYAAAKGLGFPTYNDFLEAGRKGFRTYDDFKLAIDKGIRDHHDMQKFIDLEFINKGDVVQDERVLLIVLSKIEQGKKISLNKLNTILLNTIEEYRYEDTKEMPTWFMVKIVDINELSAFLAKSNHVKRYGQYNADGEFFEINKMQDRSVILDASNVAHNSAGRVDKKVYAHNLILMIDFLKEKGFTDITVIADASLRHKVSDSGNLEKVKKMCAYLESPKETQADIFLLQYVKMNHCLIVSNDTFREWKIQDPWAADNIDFYRLSFIIKENEVLMPDLK